MEEQSAASLATARLDMVKMGVDLLEGRLMPLSKVAKVYPPDMTAAMLIEQAKGHLRRGAMPDHQSPVIQAARNYINMAAVLITVADGRLKVCEMMARRLPTMSFDELEALEWPDFEEPISRASSYCLVALGYLQAIVDTNKQRSRPASDARKLRGDRRRADLRAAAVKLKPGLSKEAAAPELAELLGYSLARTRRMLIEEFPGATWPGKK